MRVGSGGCFVVFRHCFRCLNKPDNMGGTTQPSTDGSAGVDLGVGSSLGFMQQPSPEETLINWVNEKADETAIRQEIQTQIQIVNGKPTVQGTLNLSDCPGLTSLPKGLSVVGDLDLRGCTGLTSLPEGLSVGGYLDLRVCTSLTSLPASLCVGRDLNLSDCTGLRSLPEGLRVREGLNLRGCRGLTSLPESLRVGGYLDLSHCTGLTSLPASLSVNGYLDLRYCTGLRSLPEGLRVGGALNLSDCTGLTSLPEWVFQLQRNQTVYATNTGIPVRLLQQYNTRQNANGYSGPTIEFSIRDYQSSSNVTAEQLPQLVKTITETEPNHKFWQYAAKQTDMDLLYNAFAVFLTRLLNELPAGGQRQDDLKKLKDTLTPLFRQMEDEYDQHNHDISTCNLINGVLNAAEMGIGTCIDKVKVGYVAMQLLARPGSENALKTLGAIMETVEDIGSFRVIFDTKQKKFIHVAKTILDGEFDDSLKATAKYLLYMDGTIELTEEEKAQFESSDMDKNTLTQHLVALINEKNPELYRTIHIGDPVEDILSLAYALLPSDLHKINMSYVCCSRLENSEDGDQLKPAALDYINNVS